MIVTTGYSPAKAFIAFAREFFEALANGDYQSALGKLDSTGERWTKQRLSSAVSAAIGDGYSVCSAVGFTRSASPEVIDIGNGDFELIHRLPVSGRWSEAKVRFRFVEKQHGARYSVFLLGVEA